MHYKNLIFFLLDYSVDANLFIHHLEVNTADITNCTDNIDVSTWYNWNNNNSIIANIYFMGS